MTDVTQSPALTWRATVPPQPSSSSSGWAAMTSTRFESGVISPARSRPALLAELPALQHEPVLSLDLQQRDCTLAAPHRLPASCIDSAHDRPDHLSGRSISGSPIGRK